MAFRAPRNGRSGKSPRHVRLYHYMLESEAWRSLAAIDRAIYIEIASRYAGPSSNNGRIPYSIGEAAASLKIGRATACGSIERLQERGFIQCVKQGAFSLKTKHASEWRLTEFACDVTHELASKDFMRWRPTPSVSLAKARSPLRVLETLPRGLRLDNAA